MSRSQSPTGNAVLEAAASLAGAESPRAAFPARGEKGREVSKVKT
ncbi:MAG: hypothetical protein V7K50_29505 [Nostoc sp.]